MYHHIIFVITHHFVHVILSLIIDVIWMKKNFIFLLLCIIIDWSNATLIYDYNFFHIRFEIISYIYSQLCNCLKHLVIDFLVAMDRIPFKDACIHKLEFCKFHSHCLVHKLIQIMKPNATKQNSINY